MDRNYFVYMHKNKTNGKVYIGITGQELPEMRWNYGKGYKDNDGFWNDIEEYGWDGFEHIIIKEGIDDIEAFSLEKELIEKYDSTNPDKGYNRSKGYPISKKEIRRRERVKLEKEEAERKEQELEQWRINALRLCDEKLAKIRRNNVKIESQHSYKRIDIGDLTAREVKDLFDQGTINEEQFDALLWQVYEQNKRIV